ncbi:hypothetical protein JD844_033911 [Phrynosoma platyrhinos]|uniref:Rab3 GTPase-activating protein catalytic subunit n=1 Tax=Phrynosoma platyrhinos TaxID=52577 RepID=A0ABQ7T8E2_PHRPL|nr:hypothetical protein JD844_033911 [Phrynosoma platyrhinos]
MSPCWDIVTITLWGPHQSFWTECASQQTLPCPNTIMEPSGDPARRHLWLRLNSSTEVPVEEEEFGLSDGELKDILSLDNKVLSEEFSAIVEEHYISRPEERAKLHQLLADFFEGMWSLGCKKPIQLPLSSQLVSFDQKVKPWNMDWLACRAVATSLDSLVANFAMYLSSVSCPELRFLLLLGASGGCSPGLKTGAGIAQLFGGPPNLSPALLLQGLLGSHYGHPPPLTTIREEEFETLQSQPRPGQLWASQFLAQWYSKDENGDPVVYVLQTLAQAEELNWEMEAGLCGSGAPDDDEEEDRDGCLVFFKEIKAPGPPGANGANDSFPDFEDEHSLADLKAASTSTLPHKCLKVHTVVPLCPQAPAIYLEELLRPVHCNHKPPHSPGP